MKFHRLLLAYLILCGLASAASCKKDLSPGLYGLYDPFLFLQVTPATHIIIRSAGHTIEYIFESSDLIELIVDGQPLDLGFSHNPTAQYTATSTAEALINSLCGQGFLTGSPTPALAANFALSALPAPKTAAGHTSEDVAIADFNGDGIPDSAVLTGRGIFVTLRGAAGTTLSSASFLGRQRSSSVS